MTKHHSKASLVEDVRLQHHRLEKNLAELTAEEMVLPGAVGDWSVKDVMAHLLDWEQRFIGWYAAGARGETPETPAPGMNWRQLNLLNQMIYEQYRDLPLGEVRARFDTSFEQITALLESLSEEELFSPGCYPWLRGERLADWAAANTCDHYNWAKTQIRKSKRKKT